MYLSWTTTEHQVPADVIPLSVFFSSTVDKEFLQHPASSQLSFGLTPHGAKF